MYRIPEHKHQDYRICLLYGVTNRRNLLELPDDDDDDEKRVNIYITLLDKFVNKVYNFVKNGLNLYFIDRLDTIYEIKW